MSLKYLFRLDAAVLPASQVPGSKFVVMDFNMEISYLSWSQVWMAEKP